MSTLNNSENVQKAGEGKQGKTGDSGVGLKIGEVTGDFRTWEVW